MAKKASFYRGQRATKGYKRVEAMLTPEAARALKKLTADGLPQSVVIQRAILEAAKRKLV